MSTDTQQFTTQFGQVLHHIDDAVVEFELVDGEEHSSSSNRTQSGDRYEQSSSSSRMQSDDREERSSSSSRAKPDDREPIIVDANHAFRDIFSPDMKRVIGLSLNELIVPADKQEEATQFDQRTSDGRSNVAFVERTTTDGERTFLYRGIPADGDRGYAIYTDVTDQLQRQDILTEIIALSTELSDHPEETDVESTAAAIAERAQQLTAFSDLDGSVDGGQGDE